MEKEKIKLEINFSKRWLYTFITIGILLIVGIGVYALASGIDTSQSYHKSSQVSIIIGGVEKTLQEAIDEGDIESLVVMPNFCGNEEVLWWNKNHWECGEIRLWSYNGWATNGPESCTTVCETRGESKYRCSAAQYIDNGEWASCVCGTARQKNCFCTKLVYE